MDVPKDVIGGKVISHKYRGSEYIEYRFDIIGNRKDRYGKIDIYWIQFNRPCHYAIKRIWGDGKGELTRRKGGKFMFKGNTRLYTNEEVVFFTQK